MRHTLTLFRRELAGYFLGPMAFLILLAFQVIAWLNFGDLVEALGRSSRAVAGLRDPMNAYITGSTPFWMGILVAIPALTMRLLADERRSGTIETLLTAPIGEAEVVVAKWLAAVVMYLSLLAPFALYLPFLYHQGGYRFDLGPVLALAIGLTTLGMMFAAIGVCCSALTRHQVVAAVATFAILFVLILFSSMAQAYAAARRADWAEAVRFVAVLDQAHTFGTGQLDLRFVALHLSAAVVFLYLAVLALRFRREL